MILTTFLTTQQEVQIEHWECPLCHSSGKANWRYEVTRRYLAADCKGQPIIEEGVQNCRCCGLIVSMDDDLNWYMAVGIFIEREASDDAVEA